ncbi:HIT family protein [Thiotrichales bacterium 19S11-10]|nr:HIT family protein [Thiotrichales bacterium 19S11-10]
MEQFILDSRLTSNSESIIELDFVDIRLSNNALVPWILLVPKTDKTEWFELNSDLQSKLNQLINQLSSYLKINEKVDKVNFAVIGNVVSQMHIHVIGRYQDDFCWPDVIWGKEDFRAYTKEEKEGRKQSILNYLTR